MENGITKIALLNVPCSARIPIGLVGETEKKDTESRKLKFQNLLYAMSSARGTAKYMFSPIYFQDDPSRNEVLPKPSHRFDWNCGIFAPNSYLGSFLAQTMQPLPKTHPPPTQPLTKLTHLFLSAALVSALLSFTNLANLGGEVSQVLFFLFITLWAVSFFIIRNGNQK